MYVTCRSSLTKKCDGQKNGWTDQTDGQTDRQMGSDSLESACIQRWHKNCASQIL